MWISRVMCFARMEMLCGLWFVDQIKSVAAIVLEWECTLPDGHAS